MQPTSFTLPAPVAQILGKLPVQPGSMLFAAGLEFVVRSHLPEDVLESLRDRALAIVVTDAGLRFCFSWNGQRFVAWPVGSRTPDLTISASAADFLRLARRQEDPDTLFFSRRLVMEGDTELGLLVKNTLDAFDVPLHELARQAARRPFARLKS